jgi:hypothetical protein
MMPNIERKDRRWCVEAEFTHAPRPFGCKKRYYDKPWQPSGNLLKACVIPNARAVVCRTRYRMRFSRHRGRWC